MTAQVRSVSVRMDADVASYVAKMRLAGRETDKAFASSASSLKATNREIGVAEVRLNAMTSATKAQSTATSRLNTRTSALNKAVVDLNGNLDQGQVRLVATSQGVADLGGQTRSASRDLDRGSKSIDQYSGRLSLLAEAIAVIGPAAVPLLAASVPVVGALTAGLGAAAGALGVTLLATNGLGDAFDALNEFQLEPTTENAAAMRAEFDRIGPAGEQLVRYLDSLSPVLSNLQMTARNGLFPGLEDGIDALLERVPQVRNIVASLSTTLGDLARDSGEALASGRYNDFFNYLENEAGPILSDFGRITGNIFETIANVIVALDPATQSFTDGLLDKTRELAQWSRDLGSNQSFQSFLDYIEESGPKALDFIGTFVTSLADIAQAVAPVGDVVLPVLTTVVGLLGDLAASDIGSPIFAGVAALSVYNRTLLATQAIQKRTSTAGTLGGLGTMLGIQGLSAQADKGSRSLTSLAGAAGRAALPIAGLLIASSGVADGLGLTNSASLGLLGTLGGPWGIALGTATGLALDLAHANDTLEGSIKAVNDASADDPLSDLIAKRQQLVDDFVETTTKGGFSGAMGRISAYLNGDDVNTEAAVARIDEFIAARRELRSLDTVDPLEALGEYFGDLNGVVLESTSLFYDFAEAVAAAMGILDDRAALRDYEAAIDSVSASLKENGETLDVNTEKGRANQATLDDIARTGLKVADALKGDKRRTFLDGLADQLRDTSMRFGDTKKEANDFLDDLGLIGEKKVKPEVDVDTSGLDAGTAKAMRTLDRLDLDQADPQVNLLIGKFLAGNDKALARLRELSRQKADPTADLNTDPFAALFSDTTGKLRDLDRTTATPSVRVDLGNSLAAIASVRNGLASVHDKTVYLTTVQVGGARPMAGQAAGSASTGSDGATVPKTGLPYADRHLYLLADGEEVISNRYGQADRYRAAMGIPAARRLAEGGTAGFSPFPTSTGGGTGDMRRSLEDQLAIAQALQQVRELRRSLAADGKDKLEGLNRKIAELQLRAAEKELKLAEHREKIEAKQEARQAAKDTRQNLVGLLGGFDLGSIVPDQRPTTVAGQVGDELARLKADIIDAGGEWNKSLRRWATGLIDAASELDDVNTKIAIETTKRDDLVRTLADQQQALDTLTSTMESYSDSVAGKFLSDPFNGAYTRTIPGQEATSSPELASAEAQLAAIRASATGDSVESAAAASRLIAQIAELRAREQATEATEESVSGLQALRETLLADTDAATRMAAALALLEEKGLDTTGALGGLYQQLAASGDLATAEELAALSQAQIDEYEQLFATREDAAALVAAQATQAVYSVQQAELTALVTATTAAIAASDASLAALNAQVAILGQQVRDGATAGSQAGARLLHPDLVNILHAVASIPRENGEQKKKAAV